jgi:hypothetical protein
MRAKEKSDASAVSREWPQQGADDICRLTVALALDFVGLHVALDHGSEHIQVTGHPACTSRGTLNRSAKG